jgi:hypothetical protein
MKLFEQLWQQRLPFTQVSIASPMQCPRLLGHRPACPPACPPACLLACCSGLLPLEDRVPSTPSAAHALRAEAAAHRLTNFSGSGGGAGHSLHQEAAPGQQQQAQQAQQLQPQVLAAAPAASAAGPALAAAAAAQHAVVGGGDVAARVLPRIRTSISPDRAAPGKWEAACVGRVSWTREDPSWAVSTAFLWHCNQAIAWGINVLPRPRPLCAPLAA